MAASALRLRGSTTPMVGSVGMSRSATAARNTPRTMVNLVSIVVGANEVVMCLTLDSTWDRRIERSGMLPNVTPAMARSAFSRVDDNHT
jgi:hypothetical protein